MLFCLTSYQIFDVVVNSGSGQPPPEEKENVNIEENCVLESLLNTPADQHRT